MICWWLRSCRQNSINPTETMDVSLNGLCAYVWLSLRSVLLPLYSHVYVGLLGSAVCRARLPCVSSRQSRRLVELSDRVVVVCLHFLLRRRRQQTSLYVAASFLGSVGLLRLSTRTSLDGRENADPGSGGTSKHSEASHSQISGKHLPCGSHRCK